MLIKNKNREWWKHSAGQAAPVKEKNQESKKTSLFKVAERVGERAVDRTKKTSLTGRGQVI